MRIKRPTERRQKMRFPITREVRYKVLENQRIAVAGVGTTENMSSGGIAFRSDAPLPDGAYIEMSISWPALLDGECPMRLIVFGRIMRGDERMKVCTIEKWEFRTQPRNVDTKAPLRIDGKLQRWAEYRKEVMMRTASALATA